MTIEKTVRGFVLWFIMTDKIAAFGGFGGTLVLLLGFKKMGRCDCWSDI